MTTQPRTLSSRLALTLGLAIFLALLVGAPWMLHHSPRLDVPASWDDKQQSWVIDRAAGPLQQGDRLLSIGSLSANSHTLLVDNSNLASRSQVLAWLDHKAALYQQLEGRSQVPVQIRRRGQPVELTLAVEQSSWDFLRSPGLLHLPVGIAFFIVGWACLYQVPTQANRELRQQAQWFYALCLSMSLVYLTNVTALLSSPVLWPPGQQLMNALNILNFTLGPSLLVHVALLLPRPRRGAPWMPLVHGLAAILGGLFLMPVLGMLVPLLFLSALVAIVQGWFAYPGVWERQQMKWVLAGFLAGVGPWFILNGIPLLAFGKRFFSDTVPGAFLICIPLGMAVAIQRYRLFDLGALLEGTSTYLLTIAVLVVCEVVVWSLLGTTLQVDGQLLLGTAIVVGAYGPIRHRWAALLAGWFRRHQVDPQAELKAFTAEVAGADAATVLEKLRIRVERLLAPEFIEPWSGSRQPGAELETSERPTVILAAAEGKGWRCGPLPAGRSYNSHTLQLLDALTHQAALYQENALLHQRRLEERERLLGDLHDGVGSALVAIRTVSQESAVSEMAADALFELQNFLYEGPDFALERGWLVAELRRYGREMFAAVEVPFGLAAKGQVSGTMSRGLGLAAFRIVREALTNALKHAQASRVEVEIGFDEQLHLMVWDNGRGMQGESRGRGLSGINKRVAELGGEIQWQTHPGVRLTIQLPLS